MVTDEEKIKKVIRKLMNIYIQTDSNPFYNCYENYIEYNRDGVVKYGTNVSKCYKYQLFNTRSKIYQLITDDYKTTMWQNFRLLCN